MRLDKMFLVFSFLFILFNTVAQESVQVELKKGVLEGYHNKEKNLTIFLGVPFAKPPVGELRWQAPQKLEKWTDVKKVKEFGNAPMQTNVFGDMIYRGKEKSEDCLYLNIWTPQVNSQEKLPVLVYFYGGGFVAGDGSEPRYDGAAMAQKGIVTITVNYRLNIFGFFAHPELSREAAYNASGNYGLLDQNAALEWVYDNIEAFGGDPSKITIAGESAGSISVSAHMASPLSKQFIAGAIGESGASIKPTLAPVSLDEAEQIGKEFAKNTGLSLAELRKLSTEELYKLYEESGRFGFPTVIDSYFLPETLPEIFRNGEAAQVPLLVGWNSAETPGVSLMSELSFSEENYKTKLQELYPEKYQKALQLYPAKSMEEIQKSATALASDRFIAYSTWKWFDLQRKNSKQPVYRYLFSRIRPQANKDHEYKPSGAGHATEIEYFLGNLKLIENNNFEKTDFEISEKIQKYLANFIKTGNPNSTELPQWPAADSEDTTPPVMIIDSKFEVKESESEERYRFLDENYGND